MDSTREDQPIKKQSAHTPSRKSLGVLRHGVTKKVEACGYKFYVTVNFYDDSHEPGEVFIAIGKEGGVIAGFVDALAVTFSVALQYGVPKEVILEKYKHMRFDPMDHHNPSLVHAIAEAIESVCDEQKTLWDV